MGVKFSIVLPRQPYTVGVVRRFLTEALRANGVCDECRFSILLTASEACANVIEHGTRAPNYEVKANVAGGSCLLRIVDRGPTFDADQVPLPDPDEESGRGILLMRHLSDDVTFTSSRFGGTTVQLHKRLHHGGEHSSAGCGMDRTPAMLC
ncbi:ATP-binding protein [Allosalinactinospora lopnorensis]|uniref:ATP-binding protein n=1 Tax=Allosalinactinospora lopnorensis TaxID=1352348 RepID=UPI000A907317|nr:ATP-binding protein [Allosalinactinospora lopnorensis]